MADYANNLQIVPTFMGLPMTFKAKFLNHYLASGMGSFSKRDIDVLVMHLLDEEGDAKESQPLKGMSNQQVRLKLRTPVSKIKSLRYESALKYGGDSSALAKHAKWEMIKYLVNAKFEIEQEKVCFVIEDTLTKNWVQGVLKESGLIFDNSFNTEIIKVGIKDFCDVLRAIYGDIDVEGLVEKIKKAKTANAIANAKKEFLNGVAKGIGGAIPSFIKGLIA